MSRRSDLRAQAFEIAGGQCEHPTLRATTSLVRPTLERCPLPATELAHIWPRGMGHTGYRDTLENVIAACPRHARSTDDLSSLEWNAIKRLLGKHTNETIPSGMLRAQLAEHIDQRRRAEGVDLEGSDR